MSIMNVYLQNKPEYIIAVNRSCQIFHILIMLLNCGHNDKIQHQNTRFMRYIDPGENSD
jgi:hypothetical protein